MIRQRQTIFLCLVLNAAILTLLFRAAVERGALDSLLYLNCGSGGRKKDDDTGDVPVVTISEQQCRSARGGTGTRLESLLEASWREKSLKGGGGGGGAGGGGVGGGSDVSSNTNSNRKHTFILSVNPGRAAKKVNVPRDLRDVARPFDAQAFHFGKASPRETIFGVHVLPSDNSNGDRGRGCPPHLLYLTCEPAFSLQLHHFALVNPYPLGAYSGLFVPFLRQYRPQVLAEDALLVAFAFANQMPSPYWRLGFNSLAAGASVNHLHFQHWRLDATLACEAAEIRPVDLGAYRGGGGDGDGLPPPPPSPPPAAAAAAAAANVGVSDPSAAATVVEPIAVYESTNDYPVPFLVLQGYNHQPLRTARLLMRCVRYLLAENIPHNLVMSDAGRIFLFPRHPVVTLRELRPGFPEMAGHIIALDPETFDMLEGHEFEQHLRTHIALDAASMTRVKQACAGANMRD